MYRFRTPIEALKPMKNGDVEPGKENPADLLTKIVDVPTQQHLGPWLSGKKMLNEPGPALKDMRPKEKTGKVNCACASCSEVQQMWWQRTWMV